MSTQKLTNQLHKSILHHELLQMKICKELVYIFLYFEEGNNERIFVLNIVDNQVEYIISRAIVRIKNTSLCTFPHLNLY